VVKLEIITNNPGLVDWLKEKHVNTEIDFIEGTLKDVVIKSRNKLMNGMALVTDPLAGRRVRTTPYLSVILKRGTGQLNPEEILRVEELLGNYYKNTDYLQGLDNMQDRDYQILDQSLVESALNKGIFINTTQEEIQ